MCIRDRASFGCIELANAARAVLARLAPRQALSPVFLAAPGTPSSLSLPPNKSRGWRALDLEFTLDRACLLRKSGKPDLRWRVIQSLSHLLAKVWRLSARHRDVFVAPGR